MFQWAHRALHQPRISLLLVAGSRSIVFTDTSGVAEPGPLGTVQHGTMT
jgi:hypothetical protein